MNDRSTEMSPRDVQACDCTGQVGDYAGEKYSVSQEKSAVGFYLYMLFVISWFLHLAARIPALGAIRFDLLLVVAITAIGFFDGAGESPAGGESSSTDLILKVLCVYIVASIPFVYWPGSALFTGLPNFIKAVVFYFFTVSFVTNERRLKVFVAILVACQCFRVFDPVYMHITADYWGDRAYMGTGGWQFINRLSGAPSDIVNPNGLAFVIDMAVSFLYFLGFTSGIWAAAAVFSIPVFLYALVLTASRSGMICLLVVMAGIFVKSKHRVAIAILFVLIVIIGFAKMSANDRDRYLSIVDNHTKNGNTAEGRFVQIEDDVYVGLRRPIFGHGIGTSREANANFANDDQPSHNLYTEVWEELGLIGLTIYIFFIRSIFLNFIKSGKALRKTAEPGSYLLNLANAIQVCIFMTFIFSFATYALSLDTWYLLAGLSGVLNKLAGIRIQEEPVA